jgi:hypothetical protein
MDSGGSRGVVGSIKYLNKMQNSKMLDHNRPKEPLDPVL